MVWKDECVRVLVTRISSLPLKECRFIFSPVYHLCGIRHGSNDQINGTPGDHSGSQSYRLNSRSIDCATTTVRAKINELVNLRD